MNILVTHKAVDVATYKMLGELSKNESYTIYLTVPSASEAAKVEGKCIPCLLYTSPSPRDPKTTRMPSSA